MQPDLQPDMQDFIAPVLKTFGRRPDERTLRDILPRGGAPLDLHGLRDALAKLGVDSALRPANPSQLAAHDLPALVTADDGPRMMRSPRDMAGMPDRVMPCLFFAAADDAPPANFADLTRRLAPLAARIMALSLLIGLFALAPIFFNRVLYDHIIAAGTLRRLPVMLAGVVLALAAEIGFRTWRSRLLSRTGARVDHVVSCSIFQRLLLLPPTYTEPACISAQVNRLRDFENVREFVTGPLASLLFEMPLVAIYTIVMGCLAGSLVLVPVVVVAGYAALLFAMGGYLRRCGQRSAAIGAERQQYIMRTVGKLEELRAAGMENAWQARYRDLSAKSALAAFHAGYAAQVLEVMSYVLMTLGGIATLGFGVSGVIDHSLTSGALMAAMMIIWRILAPLQICCASITRLQQVKSSIAQVDRLLALPPESGTVPDALPEFDGEIGFHRVSLRYTQDAEPALLGVSFTIMPGQIIAVRGANGSGKSSLLRVILALNQPQGGSIRIGGTDLRQFDPLALRQNIAYVPQDPFFLPGTLRDNLLFGTKDAGDAECRAALQDACALADAEALPRGLDTVIEGDGAVPLPFLLRQRINLARAYVRPAKIMLLDEASHALGRENDEAFARKLASLRGKTTVILVTHREDHMRLADAVLVMNRGELTHAGPPDQVLNALKGKSQ